MELGQSHGEVSTSEVPKGSLEKSSLEKLLVSHQVGEEEVLPDPVERCRKRIRLRRRRVQATLQKALEEDERGRCERQEAHEARLKRIMMERWHKRQEEEALLHRAMVKEREFLKSLGLVPTKHSKRRNPSAGRAEAFVTEDAGYLANVGTRSQILPNHRLMDCKLPDIRMSNCASEGRLQIMPSPCRWDERSGGRGLVF